MQLRHVLYWITGAVATLLLFASLTGDGRGPAGMGVMSHMAWSYVLGIALIGIIAWGAAESSRSSPGTDGEESAPNDLHPGRSHEPPKSPE